MKKVLLLLVSLISISNATAQDCNLTLSGEVVDFHDGKSLFQATLSIEGEEKYALTDFDGKYEISGLCPGNYVVHITHPECDTEDFKITINKDLTRNFKLEHHIEELNRVTVTGHTYHQETTSGTEASLHQEDILKYSSGSLGDALREISGVSSLNTGSTVVKPVIQGLHSSRVLVISNGTRLADQEWGIEHAPNLDVNNTANLTVVKGAGALRYGGDAVGGVIIADPQKPYVKDSLYGSTVIDGFTNGRGASVTSNVIKSYANGWYVRVQGTYKYSGDREAPDYVLSNTGNREKDFSFGFGLNKFKYGFDAFYSYYDAETGILRASHIGSNPDLIRAINSDQPLYEAPFTYDINAPKQNVRHHLAKLSAFTRFENFGKLSMDYSFQFNNRKEFDIRRGDDRDKPSLDLDLVTHTLNTNLQWDALDNMEANVGAEFSYQKNTPDPDTGVRRLIPDYEMTTVAGYATLEYYLNDRMTLDGGVRYDYRLMDATKYYRTSRWEERGYDEDYNDIVVQELDTQLLTNPVFEYHNISATLGTRYQINDNLVARANLSSASRAPNPAELFADGLHHSAAIIELGDLRNKQEQSLKASASLEATFSKLTFGLDPYYNQVYNFIQLVPVGVEFTNRGGSFPVYEYQQADSRLFGIDVNAGYRFNKRFDLKSSFAYVNGQDLENDKPLIAMPAPNWMNTLTFSKEEWNNFRISLRNQAAFKQNRFPNNDFEVTYIDANGSEVTETVKISESPAGYNLWYLNAFMDFAVLKQSKLTVGLFVDNVLDTNYRDYLNRQRYFVDDLGQNFRLQLKLTY